MVIFLKLITLVVLILIFLRQKEEKVIKKQEDLLRKKKEESLKLLYAIDNLKQENLKREKDGEDVFAIYEGTKNITTTMELEETARITRGMIRKIFDFSSGWLYLFVEEERGMFINFTYDFSSGNSSREKINTLDREVIPWIITEKKGVIIPQTQKDLRFNWEKGIDRSLLFMPLIVEGRVIGVIKMERAEQPLIAFNLNDLNKLFILCSQVAIILRRAKLYEEVGRLAIIDGLTGLYVHRYFHERLEEEIKRSLRYKSAFSLLMLDIDHFKRYNDTYGHLSGDELLRKIAHILKESVLETDIVARYGGEEFSIILLKRKKDEVSSIAEDLRERIKKTKLIVDKKATRSTVSMGIAFFPEDALNRIELIEKADHALYQAKENGRDQVILYHKRE